MGQVIQVPRPTLHAEPWTVGRRCGGAAYTITDYLLISEIFRR